MRKSIPFWQMVAFIFTSIAGTLLHFLFRWSGEKSFIALFSAVNESIWEHLKLLFYPMLASAIAGYFLWGKGITAYWCIKLRGILLGLAVIPMAYYTYTGVLGVNLDWLNIGIFFAAAGSAYWWEAKQFRKGGVSNCRAKLAVPVLVLIAAVFVAFTFLPPRIPLFMDPISGGFGLG